MMPSVNAGKNASDALALAVFKATSPTDPEPKVYCVVENMSAAVSIAPTQLPR